MESSGVKKRRRERGAPCGEMDAPFPSFSFSLPLSLSLRFLFFFSAGAHEQNTFALLY